MLELHAGAGRLHVPPRLPALAALLPAQPGCSRFALPHFCARGLYNGHVRAIQAAGASAIRLLRYELKEARGASSPLFKAAGSRLLAPDRLVVFSPIFF